jgi:hypothetical protein
MRRNLALVGAERPEPAARPVTCLTCIILISVAFWTGALWIANFLVHGGRLHY